MTPQALQAMVPLLLALFLLDCQSTSGALIQESVHIAVREPASHPDSLGRSNSKDVPALQRLNLRPLIISNRSRVVQEYIRSHLVDRKTGRFNVDLIRELLNEQRVLIRDKVKL